MLSLLSCRSDIYRRTEPRSTNNQIMPQLLDATCTQENHQKTKEIPRVPRHNFLYSSSSCLRSCEFKPLMAGVGALIDKDPLPHSGAQSVSRWLLWSSTLWLYMYLAWARVGQWRWAAVFSWVGVAWLWSIKYELVLFLPFDAFFSRCLFSLLSYLPLNGG